MAKIEWDKKTGGVVLKRHYSNETLSVSPRPVFFEELNLLKLKEFGWDYPECEEPLLWACNKQYFYKGDFTNMVQNQTLNIGEIVQKCFIKVDEKGTEAAAVTAISAEKSENQFLFFM